MKPELALSVKEPWAWLEVNALKDIENRDWRTKFRGRIYVHASLSRSEMTKEVIAFILRRLTNRQASGFMLAWEMLVFGAIIGEIDIVDCVDSSTSPWFIGKHGMVLANPVAYKKLIPCRGMPGLFRPAIGVAA